MKRLILILALFAFAPGCATTGLHLKQQAVQAAQVSEMGLEAAHDAERLLFTAGVSTPARHKAIAAVFVRAFELEIQVAQGLKLWRAGDPPPSNLAAYQRDLTEILTYALTLSADPRAQTFLQQAQVAVDQAALIAAIVGVR